MAAVLPQIAPPPALFEASRFDPEFEFLLACCRGTELFAQKVNWQRVAEVSQEHGAVPHVYEKLCGRIADADLAPIGKIYCANLRKAMLLTRELLRIYRELKACGVNVLSYKGPALACQLYGDVAARQFSDLDLLVQPADAPRAQAVLRQLGYEQPHKLTCGQEVSYLRSGYEYTFDGALGRNVVELKWAVAPRFYAIDLSVNRLFEQAVEIEIAGQRLTTLCAEDALLVLCIHAARHQWCELSWLCDLSRMQQVCELDWNSVRESAAQLGISRILAISFLLANELLGTPVPGTFRRDSVAQQMVEQLSRTITFRNEYDPESLAYFRMMMQVRERWQDRARMLTRLAFTPGIGEWNAVRLPDAMFGFYSAVRIGRLVKRFSSRSSKPTPKKLDSPEPPEAVLHPPG